MKKSFIFFISFFCLFQIFFYTQSLGIGVELPTNFSEIKEKTNYYINCLEENFTVASYDKTISNTQGITISLPLRCPDVGTFHFYGDFIIDGSSNIIFTVNESVVKLVFHGKITIQNSDNILFDTNIGFTDEGSISSNQSQIQMKNIFHDISEETKLVDALYSNIQIESLGIVSESLKTFFKFVCSVYNNITFTSCSVNDYTVESIGCRVYFKDSVSEELIMENSSLHVEESNDISKIILINSSLIFEQKNQNFNNLYIYPNSNIQGGKAVLNGNLYFGGTSSSDIYAEIVLNDGNLTIEHQSIVHFHESLIMQGDYQTNISGIILIYGDLSISKDTLIPILVLFGNLELSSSNNLEVNDSLYFTGDVGDEQIISLPLIFTGTNIMSDIGITIEIRSTFKISPKIGGTINLTNLNVNIMNGDIEINQDIEFNSINISQNNIQSELELESSLLNEKEKEIKTPQCVTISGNGNTINLTSLEINQGCFSLNKTQINTSNVIFTHSSNVELIENSQISSTGHANFTEESYFEISGNGSLIANTFDIYGNLKTKVPFYDTQKVILHLESSLLTFELKSINDSQFKNIELRIPIGQVIINNSILNNPFSRIEYQDVGVNNLEILNSTLNFKDELINLPVTKIENSIIQNFNSKFYKIDLFGNNSFEDCNISFENTVNIFGNESNLTLINSILNFESSSSLYFEEGNYLIESPINSTINFLNSDITSLQSLPSSTVSLNENTTLNLNNITINIENNWNFIDNGTLNLYELSNFTFGLSNSETSEILLSNVSVYNNSNLRINTTSQILDNSIKMYDNSNLFISGIVDDTSIYLYNQSYSELNLTGNLLTLQIQDNSTVNSLNSIILLNFFFYSGNFNFTEINGNINSNWIFGDGKETIKINPKNNTNCSITTTGNINIISNLEIYNTEINFNYDSLINIYSNNNNITSDELSLITNNGEIYFYETISKSKLKDQNQNQNEFGNEMMTFNILLNNLASGIIRCYREIKFMKDITNRATIKTVSNLLFNSENINFETDGIIQGVNETFPQITFSNINLKANTKLENAIFIINNKSIIDAEDGEISITNCQFNTNNLQINSQSSGIKTSKTTIIVNNITQIQNNFYIKDNDQTKNESKFINKGTITNLNNIQSTFNITFINEGIIEMNNSNLFIYSINNSKDLKLNNISSLNIYNDSYFMNTSNTIIDNSTLSTLNNYSFLFYGNVIFQNSSIISGNFKTYQYSNLNIIVSQDSYGIMINNSISILQQSINVNLLRNSTGSSRKDILYQVILFFDESTLDKNKLNSTDIQYIEFEYNSNVSITGEVKGCPKGRYSNNFDDEDEGCSKCASGYYNDKIGAFECKPCSSGNYSDHEGSIICEQCKPGTFQQLAAQSGCESCKAGTFSTTNGSINCKECPSGQYNNITEATSCQDCGYGKYAISTTECGLCPQGTYNNLARSFCKPCSSGTYNTKEGAQNCIGCPSSHYQDETGQTYCKLCPSHSESATSGSTSITDCFCSYGYYGPEGGPCEKCPEGAICKDIGLKIPEAEYGYWHSSKNPTLFLKCNPTEACPGGEAEQCNSELGYYGECCSECLNGFYKFGTNCAKCPSNAKSRLIIASILIVFLCLFLFIIAKKVKNYFASFSIMFSFFQILSIISGLDLNWPSNINNTWKYLSIFNFNIDFLAVDCSFQFTYSEKWIVSMLLPFVLLSVLLLIYLFTFIHSKIIEKCGAGFMRKFPRFCSKPSRKTTNKYIFPFIWIKFKISQFFTHGFSKEERKQLYNNLINSYTTILSFLYLFLAYKVLQIFGCSKQADGSYTFDAEPGNFCYKDWWYKLFYWAILLIIVYVIGIPLGLLFLLIHSSKKLDEETFDLRFGLLCARYSRRWFFWEFMIMIRKLLLTIFEIFLVSDSIIQSVFCVFILLIALIIQFRINPYIAERHNTLEFVLILFSEIILLSGMIFVSNDLETTKSKTILSTIIVAIIWISFTILILIILFEIRHRVRVKQGKDIDEVDKSMESWNGKTVIDFLKSNPSFFLILNWISESSNHRNGNQQEFFQKLKEFYSKEKNKELINLEKFWKRFDNIWKEDFILHFENWYKQIPLSEKIQVSSLLSKCYSYILTNNYQQSSPYSKFKLQELKKEDEI
ncbi:g protein-coupled receptor-related [Anaeramoeba ignava]|uniref:G protein-coupled receptor-related n=1 Tax=Anaeramoeba ignava TaxID=1746090 RepID=A0A9Q0LSI9_ANAIG|nr:g protein-coupled receptor-related [Anaeramoeba ignava]